MNLAPPCGTTHRGIPEQVAKVRCSRGWLTLLPEHRSKGCGTTDQTLPHSPELTVAPFAGCFYHLHTPTNQRHAIQNWDCYRRRPITFQTCLSSWCSYQMLHCLRKPQRRLRSLQNCKAHRECEIRDMVLWVTHFDQVKIPMFAVWLWRRTHSHVWAQEQAHWNSCLIQHWCRAETWLKNLQI